MEFYFKRMIILIFITVVVFVGRNTQGYIKNIKFIITIFFKILIISL